MTVFYDVYEWQRAWFSPLRGICAAASGTSLGLLAGPLAAAGLLHRLNGAGEPVEHDLRHYVRESYYGPLDADVISLGPFASLWRLRSAGLDHPPAVLVPPHSGFVAGVAAPLIGALLRARPVYVIEWTDARLVPESAGRFGLAEQVSVVADVFRRAGPDAIPIGLSQSVLAVLLASSLLCSGGWKPRALVLMAGPVDARYSPTPLNVMMRSQPLAMLEQLTTTVPARYPGHRRRVYPGLLPLLAYAASSPHLYFDAQARFLTEQSMGASGTWSRNHRDLHSLADVPAELFLDTVKIAFQDDSLATGRGWLPGVSSPLAHLQGARLLTIEAGEDELIGRGQTHAAHELIPGAHGAAITVPNATHHDMFTTSPSLEAVVAPLHDLLRAA